MASPALLSWIKTTIRIKNDWDDTGTGFLVSRMVGDERAKAFIVSNKHVLNRESNLRNDAQEISIYVNMVAEPENEIVCQKLIFPLHYADSTKKWREHPDPDIDVIAFDATSLITHFPNLEKSMAFYSSFADHQIINEYDISIGDEVLVIGYPSGLSQGITNHPIVRSGIIASDITKPFQDKIEESGVTRIRTNRGFLIDGATIPGSSGSPVILRPISGRYIHGKIDSNIAPAYLLGIITETYYAPVETTKWRASSFAGLGLALDAETILETIELFQNSAG